jgi:hypothetical protein
MLKAAAVTIGVLASAALAGCGSTAAGTVSAARAPQVARWSAFERVGTPIDVAIGRSDRVPVVAASGKLYLLHASGRLVRFAPAYRNAPGESYIALPAPRHRGCSFGRDNVYAIRLVNGPGITRVTASGRVSRFAKIGVPGLINGIAFDEVGVFHYRLLVTIGHGLTTTIDAINCHGTVTTITSGAPRVEGGIAVAPRSFGRFGGDLIAPDELSGRIFAIGPTGRSRLVVNSGLPFGQDIGVESEAFVPADRRAVLLVSDRLTPRNRHPGDNLLLRIGHSQLQAAGVRPHDLLVTTEGGALTDVVSCRPARCSVHFVARGPARAHIEGHIGWIAP